MAEFVRGPADNDKDNDNNDDNDATTTNDNDNDDSSNDNNNNNENIIVGEFVRGPAASTRSPQIQNSDGGMIWLETLIELKLLNSSCSSLSSY